MYIVKSEEARRFAHDTHIANPNNPVVILRFAILTLTRIILRPLSALSLDEGLNSPCDKKPSAAL